MPSNGSHAAAAGTTRLRRKLADAIDLARLHGSEAVGKALVAAAHAGRYVDGDLDAILTHQAQRTVIPFPARASDAQTLQRSTKSWEGFG